MKKISDVLLEHFQTYDKFITSYLKSEIDNFYELVSNFMNSKTDVEKITNSIILVEKICRANDMGDLLPFYAQVGIVEYFKLLKYDKQRDHTSHTVFLFLFGVYLIENSDELYNELVSSFKNKNEKSITKILLLRWIYSSIYHDIGYLLTDQHSVSLNENCILIERMFGTSNIMREIKRDYIVIDDNELKLKIDDFLMSKGYSNISELLGPISKKRSGEFYEECTLNNYMCEKNPIVKMEDGLAIEIIEFLVLICKSNINQMSKTSMETVNLFLDILNERTNKNSVNPNTNTSIGHDIVGGIILFSYTLMWYQIKDLLLKSSYQLRDNRRFQYDDESFRHVAAGCIAVLLHNNNDSVQFETNPLLYLSILCDEVQIWDRYPSGMKVTNQFLHEVIKMIELNEDYFDFLPQDYSSSNNIYMELDRSNMKPKVSITLLETGYNIVKNNLNKKLIAWENFIHIKSK